MAIKDQWEKIKENWFIALLMLVLVFVVVSGNSLFTGITSFESRALGMYDSAMEAGFNGVVSSKAYYPSPSAQEDFAPDVEERQITKTANLNTEVERGQFSEAVSKVDSIIKTSDAILLNQNINTYGKGLSSYMYGYFQLKVDSEKYDAVVSQLKAVGEVKSFNENAQDITGQVTSLEDRLKFEKEKLSRYEQMYKDATDVEDKINLNDRIVSQQRTIKYLEDALERQGNRVSYSTIYFSMTEKQSGYANLAVVKISELARSFVNSFNDVLKLLFWAIPWAAALFILKLAWNMFKGKGKKK